MPSYSTWWCGVTIVLLRPGPAGWAAKVETEWIADGYLVRWWDFAVGVIKLMWAYHLLYSLLPGVGFSFVWIVIDDKVYGHASDMVFND